MGQEPGYDEDERYDEMKKDYDAMKGYESMCRDAAGATYCISAKSDGTQGA